MAHRIRFDRRFDRRRVLAAGLASLAAPRIARAVPPVQVFAAASLRGPLDEIAPNAVISYGGSGGIARQVARGAPADLVILAAADWMDWLIAEGAVTKPQIVARNTLVLAGPEGGDRLDITAEAVLSRLAGGRLAMGDPMSVPAGRYAQQALETLGLWPVLSPHALLTENVRAALAYVARGDVPLAAVYRSDARLPGVSEIAAFPETSHAPVVYPAALRPGAGPDASALLGRITLASDVFADHGFRGA